MTKPGRPGANRKKKGPQVGSGGQGRQALEGKGPTPKAEDRPYHRSGKRKAAIERSRDRAALPAKSGEKAAATRGRGRSLVTDAEIAAKAFEERVAKRRTPKTTDSAELVTGRNSVLEALQARIPATTLYLAQRIEFDDRVKEIIQIANGRNLPILEITRQELDRMSSEGTVHQGVGIKVPAYEYRHPLDLLDEVIESGQTPLFVALDGITDPRNLGAIIRSVAAFGGHGVIVPQRRSVSVTASAWKTSAGAAARVPVAMASNLNNALKDFKARGLFVLGLDGGGAVSLPDLELGTSPIVLVIGSEGKGLSRLVTEHCDAIVSIPIQASTESLNAGIAAGVALYEVSRKRSA